jgi:hypothetical protein
MEGIKSKDGKDVIDIVLEIYAGKIIPKPKLPKNHENWTNEENDSNDDWQDKRWTEFYKVADKEKWG